jgi:hypothetical protein
MTAYSTPHAGLCDRECALLTLRRLFAFVEERSHADWRQHSEWRRLRIALNLRWVAVTRSLAVLDASPSRGGRVLAAMASLNVIASTLPLGSDDDEVRLESAHALRGAVEDLRAATAAMLRPAAVPDP